MCRGATSKVLAAAGEQSVTVSSPPETAMQNAALETIAREHLGFADLATRNSDSLDFRDVAVWAAKAALEAAYEAGRQAVAP